MARAAAAKPAKRGSNRTAAKTTVRAKSAAKNGRATARKAPAAKARKASPRAKSIIATTPSMA